MCRSGSQPAQKSECSRDSRCLSFLCGALVFQAGTPSPDVLNAMEREHSSTEPFNSHNVFGTTPLDEWLYGTTSSTRTEDQPNGAAIELSRDRAHAARGARSNPTCDSGDDGSGDALEW